MKTALGFGAVVAGGIVGMVVTVTTGHAVLGLPIGLLIMSPAIFLLREFRAARKSEINGE